MTRPSLTVVHVHAHVCTECDYCHIPKRFCIVSLSGDDRSFLTQDGSVLLNHFYVAGHPVAREPLFHRAARKNGRNH